MDPRPAPLDVQVFDLADQLLDLGAELLALREVMEERGVRIDDDDLLLRVLRYKARLAEDHRAVSGQLVSLDRSRVEELLASSDRGPAA